MKFWAVAQNGKLVTVAPPRGERGLKYLDYLSRGGGGQVAPPRGERGLKSVCMLQNAFDIQSLPLVGSVD